MNNLGEWFGSGLKIKRWLILVLIGTIVLSYGFANLKLATQLNFQSIIVTMLYFVIGIFLIVMGFLMTQRRILQAVAESSVSSKTRNLNLKKLLFDKKTLDKSIKVVVIGQGDGMAALLNGMKLFSNNITAIVSTIEDDSTSKQVEITEIKRAMVALAENNEKELERFMDYNSRYGVDMVAMMFESMMDIHDNNFSKAVCSLSDVIAMSGKVLPATLDKVSMGAVLSDNSRVHGQKEMIEKVIQKKLPIERIFLTPERCTPAPNVIKSIKEADLIIIGPGSLYTGILPILLIREIADEIKKSKATKIFVSNIMTEHGQTDNYSLSEHINALHEHAGKGIVDYCIASDSDIMPEYIRMYNQNGSDIIDIDKPRVKNTGVRLVVKDMSVVGEKGKIRHDSIKLAKEIIDIMCQNMDLASDKQALEYYNIKTKLKNVNSKKKKKNVLFRNLKVISKGSKKK